MITSGLIAYSAGKGSDETTPISEGFQSARGVTEETSSGFYHQGVRETCVRLAATVHGKGI